MKIPLTKIPVAVSPLLMLFFCVTGCGTMSTPQLLEFQSDGCTFYPEGISSELVLWRDDCVVHDYAYWKGGTWKERRVADRKLRDGIRRKGKPVIAQLAYMGVRLGGESRGYQPLSAGALGGTNFPEAIDR